MHEPIGKAGLRKARTTGVFYALNIVTGAASLALRGNVATAVTLVSTICYVVVTVLLYDLFRPVQRGLSALAAASSMVGCALGALAALRLVPGTINPLAFFGIYCLLVGYLVVRSTFLPAVLGIGLAIGGIGWLTFISPTLARSLIPYNMAPGILAETAFTVWLLVVGLNGERWLALAAKPQVAQPPN